MSTSVRFASVGVALTVCMASGGALAGYTQAIPVTLEGAAGAPNGAIGGIGAARYSSDPVQDIGCEIYSPAGSTPTALCYATNAAGTTVSCLTTDVNLVATAGRISEATVLNFTFTSNGDCALVMVDNGSSWVH
jgi:hypothetical protein